MDYFNSRVCRLQQSSRRARRRTIGDWITALAASGSSVVGPVTTRSSDSGAFHTHVTGVLKSPGPPPVGKYARPAENARV